MSSNYLYIPVEVKVREFNAKLLLSLFAVESGFKCIIGKRHDLKNKLLDLPRGIVIEKGLDSPGKEKIIFSYQLCGHNVVAIDEEGLVINEDIYISRRIRKKALKRVNKVFAWGKKQADIICHAYPLLEDRIAITGNARLDLLRKDFHVWFKNEINLLKNKYGNFILINSSLSRASLKEGLDEYIRKEKGKGLFKESSHAVFFIGEIEHQKKILNYFCEMVIALNKTFPETKIVIRPHPSEDPISWESRLGNLTNVFITLEGNVVPWLLAAKVMIHNNCTTAIESYLLGKTPIAFRPVISDEYDSAITNYVSYSTFSINEILDVLKSNLSTVVKLSEDSKSIINKYINFPEDKYCCDNIVDELIRLNQNKKKKWYRYFISLIRLFYKLKNLLENDILKQMIQPGREKNKRQYRDFKFPDTNLEEVADLVKKYQSALGRFRDVKVENISKNLFMIYSDME